MKTGIKQSKRSLKHEFEKRCKKIKKTFIILISTILTFTACGSEVLDESTSNSTQDKLSEDIAFTEGAENEEPTISSNQTPDAQPTYTPEPANNASYDLSAPTYKDGVTTWDTVYFGSYMQSEDTSVKKPIKWRVLSVNGDDAFLLADKILDYEKYNEVREDVTWETCTLRKWLNENFYNEAFDTEEKGAITETVVVNDDNHWRETNGGNDTKDNVYLLSISEASNVELGFDLGDDGLEYDAEWGIDPAIDNFIVNTKLRKAKITNYAKYKGAVESGYDYWYGWWLRSPGGSGNEASYVSGNGGGEIIGNYVDNSSYGVRPALHINLSSSSWEHAGKVSSKR